MEMGMRCPVFICRIFIPLFHTSFILLLVNLECCSLSMRHNIYMLRANTNRCPNYSNSNFSFLSHCQRCVVFLGLSYLRGYYYYVIVLVRKCAKCISIYMLASYGDKLNHYTYASKVRPKDIMSPNYFSSEQIAWMQSNRMEWNGMNICMSYARMIRLILLASCRLVVKVKNISIRRATNTIFHSE